jgi:hypothetical protein
MLPLSDGMSRRRFPIVNVALSAFLFGVIVTRALLDARRLTPQGHVAVGSAA